MLTGMVMYSWAYGNDSWHQFAGVYPIDGAYVGQEADNLLVELKEIKRYDKRRTI